MILGSEHHHMVLYDRCVRRDERTDKRGGIAFFRDDRFVVILSSDDRRQLGYYLATVPIDNSKWSDLLKRSYSR